MFCQNCGSEMKDGICPKCGASQNMNYGNNVQMNQPLNGGYNQSPQVVYVEKPEKKSKGKGCLIFLIVLLVLIFVVRACASGYVKKAKETTSNSSATNNASVSVETSADGENNDVNSNGDISQTADQVIYDADNIKITYKGYTAAELFSSASLDFLIENNSDKNITVENFNFEVNGYTLDGWFYEQITAGTKANASIDLSKAQLNENGIETLGTVVFSFKVTDSDNYDELFTTDNVTVTFDESVQSGENEDLSSYEQLYTSNGVTVYYKGYIEDDGIFPSTDLNFLIVNDSEQNVRVVSDNCSVDGFSISPSDVNSTCLAGKMTNDKMSFYKSTLEEQGIDKISEIQFTLRCYDSDSYKDIWETEYITINIQ